MKTTAMAQVLLLAISLLFAVAAWGGTSTSGKPCDTRTAACGKCGDGYCARQCGETAQSCPADCGSVDRLACGKCGDGRCTPQCGETAASCPKDCGLESQHLVVDLDD